MTDINDLKGRFYIQETHIRLKDGGKTTHKNGVVYTPAECVDFINNSVNALLQKEFGVKLNDPCVRVLDPFAGTGIFLSRAIEQGLIDPERQDVHQFELMPDSAEIARDNARVSCEYAGSHGHVHTHCVDTFTLDPQIDPNDLPELEP